MLRRTLAPLSLFLMAILSGAQSNTVPGLEVRLSELSDIDALGRIGAFPNGINGVSIMTQICNNGTVSVPWEEPMSPKHPFIAPLIVKATSGRLVQISDRSFIKHGINAQNIDCTSCQNPPGPPGDTLGIGCLDTYKVTTNGNSYHLGPPDEIDPYLGTWDPVCSHFDRGEPSVGAPEDCDGVRSLSTAQASALGPVAHRMHLSDAELTSPEGTLFFQGHYLVLGEAESNRANNLGSRGFASNWNGSSWNLTPTGPLVLGSVLTRWSGASLGSATNGTDDGRVYAAVKVSGPTNGIWRYEYALHNRDNERGVGAFRIPICDDARVLAAGFRDIDGDATTDWSVSRPAGQLVWSTTSNPLRWNSIYNFWFDSDAAPTIGAVEVDAFDFGAGAASFAITSTVPGALWNVHLGMGCSAGPSPTLFATGSPARATIGNASFGVTSTGNQGGQSNLLFYNLTSGSFSFMGCAVWMGGVPIQASSVTSDGAGIANHPIPIPNDPGLEGLLVNAQCLGFRPGGPLLGFAELSDGLQIRIGSNTAPCP